MRQNLPNFLGPYHLVADNRIMFAATFCNRAQESANGLLLLDPHFSPLSWVPYPADGVLDLGLTGLCSHQGYIYAVTQSSTPRLLVFDTQMNWLASSPLANVRDAHSLVVHRSELFVASTGNDSVYRLVLNKRRTELLEEDLHWGAGAAGKDTIHLNSLCSNKQALFATAFNVDGRKRRQGVILNLDQNTTIADGLFHPHSLMAEGDSLLTLSSADAKIKRFDLWGRLLQEIRLVGYLRGLTRFRGGYLVGRSSSRLVSRSTGQSLQLTLPTDCAEFYVLNKSLHLTRRIPCAAYGHEIYDLVTFKPRMHVMESIVSYISAGRRRAA